MADKAKKQKAKPQQKVVRYKPNINLLKNLNVILLITGFLASIFTISLLSSRSDNYDVRSRGQEVTPTITPTPVCPTGTCITPPVER